MIRQEFGIAPQPEVPDRLAPPSRIHPAGSHGGSLAGAIRRRSPRGWPPTGRASRKSPTAAPPHIALIDEAGC